MQNHLPIVKLLVQRLEHDFENTAVKLRKAYSAKDVDALSGM